VNEKEALDYRVQMARQRLELVKKYGLTPTPQDEIDRKFLAEKEKKDA